MFECDIFLQHKPTRQDWKRSSLNSRLWTAWCKGGTLQADCFVSAFFSHRFFPFVGFFLGTSLLAWPPSCQAIFKPHHTCIVRILRLIAKDEDLLVWSMCAVVVIGHCNNTWTKAMRTTVSVKVHLHAVTVHFSACHCPTWGRRKNPKNDHWGLWMEWMVFVILDPWLQSLNCVTFGSLLHGDALGESSKWEQEFLISQPKKGSTSESSSFSKKASDHWLMWCCHADFHPFPLVIDARPVCVHQLWNEERPFVVKTVTCHGALHAVCLHKVRNSCNVLWALRGSVHTNAACTRGLKICWNEHPQCVGTCPGLAALAGPNPFLQGHPESCHESKNFGRR